MPIKRANRLCVPVARSHDNRNSCVGRIRLLPINAPGSGDGTGTFRRSEPARTPLFEWRRARRERLAKNHPTAPVHGVPEVLYFAVGSLPALTVQLLFS